MNRTIGKAIAPRNFLLLTLLSAACLIQPKNAQAEDAKAPFTRIAPLDHFGRQMVGWNRRTARIRVFQAMMKMVKIDIEGLKRAHRGE